MFSVDICSMSQWFFDNFSAKVVAKDKDLA